MLALEASHSGTQEMLRSLVERVKALLAKAGAASTLGGALFSAAADRAAVDATQYAEAAYTLALAGVDQRPLFNGLADATWRAVEAVAKAPGSAAERAALLDVTSIAECLAVAGIDSEHPVFEALSGTAKGGAAGGKTRAALPAALHDPASLARLWRHSASQHKRKAVSKPAEGSPPLGPASRPWRLVDVSLYAAKADDGVFDAARGTLDVSGDMTGMRPPVPSDLFADPSLPLVVDVGCGFGVSLLGMALERSEGGEGGEGTRFNYLGGDLSGHAIGFANGLARRWGLTRHTTAQAPSMLAAESGDAVLAAGAAARARAKAGGSGDLGAGRVAFCVTDAESLVRWAKYVYAGPVVQLLIQFPTPYKLEKGGGAAGGAGEPQAKKAKKAGGGGGGGGGFHLPSKEQASYSEDGVTFMVTPTLMELCASALAPDGLLYVSSNVEDVAVTMKGLLTKSDTAGEFEPHAPADAETSGSAAEASHWAAAVQWDVPLRQRRWAEQGGERATGSGWLQSNPQGAIARTETEAVYETDGKPVHRGCWVRKSSSSSSSSSSTIAAIAATAAAAPPAAKAKAKKRPLAQPDEAPQKVTKKTKKAKGNKVGSIIDSADLVMFR